MAYINLSRDSLHAQKIIHFGNHTAPRACRSGTYHLPCCVPLIILQTLIPLLQLLDVARADAEGLSSSVQRTSALSERVSKKVRELDTAQSRAHEAADRIKRLVNRTKAVAGVQQAIAVNDYETAAKYVEEHLQLQREMSTGGGTENPHPSEQEKVSSKIPDMLWTFYSGRRAPAYCTENTKAAVL